MVDFPIRQILLHVTFSFSPKLKTSLKEQIFQARMPRLTIILRSKNGTLQNNKPNYERRASPDTTPGVDFFFFGAQLHFGWNLPKFCCISINCTQNGACFKKRSSPALLPLFCHSRPNSSSS